MQRKKWITKADGTNKGTKNGKPWHNFGNDSPLKHDSHCQLRHFERYSNFQYFCNAASQQMIPATKSQKGFCQATDFVPNTHVTHPLSTTYCVNPYLVTVEDTCSLH